MADPIEIAKKSFVRKSSSEQNVMDYGKLPPQVKDLEEAVLGAVMIEQNAINDISDILKDESFYVDAHQRIWKAIRLLYQNQAPIDLLTVTEQLKKNGDLESCPRSAVKVTTSAPYSVCSHLRMTEVSSPPE